MRLPFLWIALGFSLGIVAEKYVNIPAGGAACVLGAGAVLLWFLRGRRIFLPVFMLSLACAGGLWAELDQYAPPHAVRNFTGQDRLTLRGTVNSLPEVRTRGKKVTVSFVLSARSITRTVGGRRKFSKVTGNVQVFLIQPGWVPQVGDTLRLFGELSAPRQVLNPGEFDYGDFLEQKDIHAIFRSIGKKCVRMTKAGGPWTPARMIADVRRRLASMVEKLYRSPEAAIVKALVLGLRSDVSPEIRSQFMKTGTIHLFATANTKRNFAPFSNKNIAAYSS